MSVRTSLSLGFSVGFDNALDDCVFNRDQTAILDTLERASSQVISLSGSEVDWEVAMGDVAEGRILYVEADGDIEVNLNGISTDPLILTRAIAPSASSAADLKSYLFTTATFTSVHLTNTLATAVRVRVCIVGDLVV